MKRLLSLPLVFVLILLHAQVSIIPEPVEIKMPATPGSFALSPDTRIVLEGSHLENSADFLNNYLSEFYHLKLKVTSKSVGKNEIVLNFDRLDHDIEGAYTLTSDKKGIYIGGDNEAGGMSGSDLTGTSSPV